MLCSVCCHSVFLSIAKKAPIQLQVVPQQLVIRCDAGLESRPVSGGEGRHEAKLSAPHLVGPRQGRWELVIRRFLLLGEWCSAIIRTASSDETKMRNIACDSWKTLMISCKGISHAHKTFSSARCATSTSSSRTSVVGSRKQSMEARTSKLSFLLTKRGQCQPHRSYPALKA